MMKTHTHSITASGILQLHVIVPKEACNRVLQVAGQHLVSSHHITLVRLDDLGLQPQACRFPDPPAVIDFLPEVFYVDTGIKQACYLIATDEMQGILQRYALDCAEFLEIGRDAVDEKRVYHVTLSNAGGGDVRASVGAPWEYPRQRL
jgi:hypothetical protein